MSSSRTHTFSRRSTADNVAQVDSPIVGIPIGQAALCFGVSDGSPSPNSGPNVAQISPWLNTVMGIVATSIEFWFPAGLLAVTLRFDYSRDPRPISFR